MKCDQTSEQVKGVCFVHTSHFHHGRCLFLCSDTLQYSTTPFAYLQLYSCQHFAQCTSLIFSFSTALQIFFSHRTTAQGQQRTSIMNTHTLTNTHHACFTNPADPQGRIKWAYAIHFAWTTGGDRACKRLTEATNTHQMSWLSSMMASTTREDMMDAEKLALMTSSTTESTCVQEAIAKAAACNNKIWNARAWRRQTLIYDITPVDGVDLCVRGVIENAL